MEVEETGALCPGRPTGAAGGRFPSPFLIIFFGTGTLQTSNVVWEVDNFSFGVVPEPSTGTCQPV